MCLWLVLGGDAGIFIELPWPRSGDFRIGILINYCYCVLVCLVGAKETLAWPVETNTKSNSSCSESIGRKLHIRKLPRTHYEAWGMDQADPWLLKAQCGCLVWPWYSLGVYRSCPSRLYNKNHCCCERKSWCLFWHFHCRSHNTEIWGESCTHSCVRQDWSEFR